jgi:hypothetical protein
MSVVGNPMMHVPMVHGVEIHPQGTGPNGTNGATSFISSNDAQKGSIRPMGATVTVLFPPLSSSSSFFLLPFFCS